MRALTLEADSFSTAIPALPWTSGCVHSVFRRVLNVDVGVPDLVSIASPEVGELPNGVHLRAPVDFTSLEAGLAPGAIVFARPEAVRVGGIVVGVAHARRVECELASRDLPTNARCKVRSMLERIGRCCGPAPGWLDEGRDRLREALVARDEAAIREAVSALVGAGPGLTPSGDDVLVGCMAGLVSVGHASRPLLGRSIGFFAERTTRIAGTLLRHATAGRFAAVVAALARAPWGEEDEAERAHVRMRACGATSGEDTVLGFALGLSSWLGGSLYGDGCARDGAWATMRGARHFS